MPKFRTFEKIYKDLNVKQIQETPRIPEEELPSNNLSQSDHSICDFLFEDYKDRKGHLRWKQKTYKIDDEQLKQLRQMLMKDLEGEL